MAYYRDHSIEGRDAASLADLRRRCAAVLSDRLGREVGVETLLGAISFHPFADAAPALAALRARGLATGLRLQLGRLAARRAGALRARLGRSTRSSAPPRPARASPTRRSSSGRWRLAGCSPEEALHVGDTPEEDIAGARAAGMRALLIRRDGGGDVVLAREVAEHV